MTRLRTAVGAALLSAGLAALVGCSDDGAGVRNNTSSGGSGSGAGSGSGSSSGSSSGEQGTSGPAKTRQIQAAVDSYRSYVLGEVAKLRAATTGFTDAVRAGDLAGAQRLYAPSRYSWETIEPVADLAPDIDAAVDGGVDKVSGPDDPKFTGWHRLEYLLWSKHTTSGAAPFADRLDSDLATLQSRLRTVAITPKAMVTGAAELVDEAAKDKIGGEEERWSHTDLSDIAANTDGAQAVYRTVTPLLKNKDSALFNTLQRDFGAVTASLAEYLAAGGGYRPSTDLQAEDKARLQAELTTLAQNLAKVPAALDL